MKQYRWLDRRIARPGPFLTLCLNEDEFNHVLVKLKVHERPAWVNFGADATTHHLNNQTGDAACVICIRDSNRHNSIEVAGMLVHEAVHVWQEYCDMLGEKQPGREQEAYAVQAIAQELMAEFKRRMEQKEKE